DRHRADEARGAGVGRSRSGQSRAGLGRGWREGSVHRGSVALRAARSRRPVHPRSLREARASVRLPNDSLPVALAFATRDRARIAATRAWANRATRWAMRFGIDFGTTRTVVTAVQDGRHPIVAFDDHGEFRSYVPGIAAMRGGELLLGWRAAHALATGDAEHAIRSIKRVAQSLMPDDEVPGLPGITALELVTAFLRELRTAIVERSTIEVTQPLEAMVSVPANAASRH